MRPLHSFPGEPATCAGVGRRFPLSPGREPVLLLAARLPVTHEVSVSSPWICPVCGGRYEGLSHRVCLEQATAVAQEIAQQLLIASLGRYQETFLRRLQALHPWLQWEDDEE